MKLNRKRTIYVGFAFLIICMFWQVYDSVIAKILIDSFGLSQTASGVIMALDNIFAIVLLPIFGALSDKTNTKMGKRKPYILFGTICASILLVGVSIFDNAQMTKIKEANIGDITTIVFEAQETREVIKLDNGKEVVIEYTFDEGDTAYEYKYENVTKLYETKELAAQARGVNVAEVRQFNSGYFIGFIVALLFVLLSMAVFRTPAVSLMPDVTPKPLRSSANAIINLMGAVGGITALIIMNFLAKDYQSYSTLFIVIGTIMLLCLAFFMWKVNEPKFNKEMEDVQKEYGIDDTISEEEALTGDAKLPKDVLKSLIFILLSVIFWYMAYNAATSKFSVYATTVLDTGYSLPLLVAQAAAIVTYIPIGNLSNKIGRKKTVLIGVGILFSAFFLASIINANTAILVWVAMALAGIGWATINVNSYPMVVEMSNGSNVGKYTGIYYTASMTAQIITPVFSGMLMDTIGFRVLFPYCVFFCALAFVTMLFVKHGEAKKIKK